jgi:hypothetical protein
MNTRLGGYRQGAPRSTQEEGSGTLYNATKDTANMNEDCYNLNTLRELPAWSLWLLKPSDILLDTATSQTHREIPRKYR